MKNLESLKDFYEKTDDKCHQIKYGNLKCKQTVDARSIGIWQLKSNKPYLIFFSRKLRFELL